MTKMSSESNGSIQKPLLDTTSSKAGDSSKMLMISFGLMIVIGLGNKIFQVLMYQPLYNYPLFVNMLTTFVYIPVSFAYIIPMIKYGKEISPESQEFPKSKFAVMGLLDSIAGLMISLAVTYLANGSLVQILSQSAIPVSMVISKLLLGTQYKNNQFVGAFIVFAGLAVVLVPLFLTPSPSQLSNLELIIWCFVMMLSAIPQCLSSVYKEKALGNVEMDAMYLNGWIAVFQFLASVALLYPSAPAANVKMDAVMDNIWNGFKCLGGENSVVTGPNPDDCSTAALYFTIYVLFNIGYNLLIILILKYGSANILWLAMTVMVPMANCAFALPFMPNHKPLKATDIIGLVLICFGLFVYRFYEKAVKRWEHWNASRNAPDGFQVTNTLDSPIFGPRNAHESQGNLNSGATPAAGSKHVPRYAQPPVASSRNPVMCVQSNSFHPDNRNKVNARVNSARNPGS